MSGESRKYAPEIEREIKIMRSQGYGLCKGCGGWESISEVLRPLEGYCSSSCERDDRED